MDLLLFMGTGIVFGFAISRLANKIRLPSVVGYIVAGILLSPSFFGLYTYKTIYQMDSLSDFALSLVAFTIGSQLRWKEMAKVGKKVLFIIFAQSMGTFLCVFGGIWVLTGEIHTALIFAAMAPATAPAGTVAVLQECRAKGNFTNTILAVVGLDDGFAIIIYAFAIALARLTMHTSAGINASVNFTKTLALPLVGIFGAILLGLILGFILTYFVRKLRSREHVLILTIGMVLTCTGIANHYHLSLILANLTLGMFIANTYPRASHRSLEGIQGITPPIFVIFFVLAGAHLKISLLKEISMIGLIYFTMRIVGKLAGAYYGCWQSKASLVLRKYLGLATLSQAGVAIGLSLLVQKELRAMGVEQEYLGLLVINTIAATTLLFEILGPIMTKIAIVHAGEAGKVE